MNILLTSVGRRSYLVDYFKNALAGSGKVVCTNMYEHAAGMYSADVAIVTPPSCDPDYIYEIVRICSDYEIGLVCSLHDLDVFILSQNADKLRHVGAFPVLPSADWGRIALDKYECTCLLRENGFAVPWTTVDYEEALGAISSGVLVFPVVVKARMGFGSQGLCVCHDMSQFIAAYAQAQKEIDAIGFSNYASFPYDQGVLIQQFVNGKEFRIDVVNDLEGHFACSLTLEVHAMRSGETDMATTIDPAFAEDFSRRFAQLSGHLGIWGIDCLQSQGENYVIDINPRFSGEYPFFQLAGANIPAALISWAKGQAVDPSWLRVRAGVRAYKDLVPKCVTGRCEDE